jgi:uncharacterized protein YcnI
MPGIVFDDTIPTRGSRHARQDASMRRYVTAASLALATLWLAAAARAHVTVMPAFAASGGTVTVTIDAPNERAGAPMTGLSLALPSGLRAEPDEQPETPGWTLHAAGRTVSWDGGSLAPDASQQFTLRLEADGAPGAVSIRAEQRYPDGRSVEWTPAFTVLPAASEAPSQHLGRALVAAVVGLAVIAVSLLAVRRLRRGSLQEE